MYIVPIKLLVCQSATSGSVAGGLGLRRANYNPQFDISVL